MKTSLIRFAVLAAAGCYGIAGATAAQAQSSQSRLCNVDQVAVFENRIHVKCAPNADQAFTKDIPYYAMNIGKDAKVIDNIIALAVGAKVTRKPLVVWYDFSDYQSVPGCNGTNCRRLVAAALE